jgi:hypothetical protein
MNKTSESLSERQLDILRHALGWPACYRNHYVTDEGSDNFDDCEHLVTMGMMDRRQISWVPGYVYTVTSAGRTFVEHPRR